MLWTCCMTWCFNDPHCSLWPIRAQQKELFTKGNATHVGHRTGSNQVGTYWKAFSLMNSFHGSRRCYAGCWRRFPSYSLTMLMLPRHFTANPKRVSQSCLLSMTPFNIMPTARINDTGKNHDAPCIMYICYTSPAVCQAFLLMLHCCPMENSSVVWCFFFSLIQVGFHLFHQNFQRQVIADGISLLLSKSLAIYFTKNIMKNW